MGVASIVLGVIGLVICCTVILAPLSILLAVIGLILGIVDFVKKKKKDEKRGSAIIGIAFSAISIVMSIIFSIVLGFVILCAIDEANTNTNMYRNSNSRNIDNYSWSRNMNADRNSNI